jgi:hypothetical protein
MLDLLMALMITLIVFVFFKDFMSITRVQAVKLGTFVFFLFMGTAYAQDLPQEALPPEWIGGLLVWLKSVPTVGPIIVEVLKWVSVVVTVLTVLSTCIQAILKIPEIGLRISGATKLADSIKKVSDKIMPWLKYFSAYNVQAVKK